MDGEVSSYMVAVLADDKGLIHLLHDSPIKDIVPRDYFKNFEFCREINPYTFRDNFMLTPQDCINHDAVGKWTHDPEMTQRVFDNSMIEASQPTNHFRLRKGLGMEMGKPTNNPIFCYRNSEPPEGAVLNVGTYGYIFIAEPQIIEAIEGMGMAHEVMGK